MMSRVVIAATLLLALVLPSQAQMELCNKYKKPEKPTWARIAENKAAGDRAGEGEGRGAGR